MTANNEIPGKQIDTGTAQGQVVELDAIGLPAVDGSQLLNVTSANVVGADGTGSGNGDDIQIKSGDSGPSGGDGGTTRVYGGDALGNDYGGNVVLYAGNGLSSGGTGGVVQIYGGDGDSSGAVEINGGNATGPASNPGSPVQITGGAGYNTGAGGRVDIYGGSSTSGAGGNIIVRAGPSGAATSGGQVKIYGGVAGSSGTGGNILLQGTDGGASAGGGGDITMRCGDGIAGGTIGGVVYLEPGSGTSSDGHIEINGPAGGGNTAEVRFQEAPTSGLNYVSLQAPASVPSDAKLILPTTVGLPGQALVSDGNNPANLTWASFGATVPVGTIVPYGGSTPPAGWLLCDGSSVDSVVYPDLFNAIGTTYGNPGGGFFNLPDLRGRTAIGSGTGDAPDATAHALGQKTGTETHTLSVTQIPSHNHPGSSVLSDAHTHSLSITVNSDAHTHTLSINSDNHSHSGTADAVGNHNHGISWNTNATGSGDNEIISWDGVADGVTGPGGAHSHTLSINSDSHSHTGTALSDSHNHTASGTALSDSHSHTLSLASQGNGLSHPNMQPYLAVNYIILAIPPVSPMGVLQANNAGSPYSILPSVQIVVVDASAGPVTLNLHAVAADRSNPLYIKRKDATGNAVTVDADTTETIDGALTQPVTGQYTVLGLVHDGVEWWII